MSSSAVGPLIIVVCLGFLFFITRRALIRRGEFARVRKGALYGPSDETPRPGSAADIADAGVVPAQELLGALGVPGRSELNADGEEDGASGLGLKLHAGGSSTNQLVQVMEGERGGRQTFIRQGLVGNSLSPGLGLRRSRNITVVRVGTPAFEARMEEGGIEADARASAAVRGFFEVLAPSPDVWHDGRLVAGPEGIVVSRAAADDWLGGWIYDLWLLERLAQVLKAPTLPPVHLDRWWEAPYGLDSWAPSLVDAATGR
jgi:hypothetical protein